MNNLSAILDTDDVPYVQNMISYLTLVRTSLGRNISRTKVQKRVAVVLVPPIIKTSISSRIELSASV